MIEAKSHSHSTTPFHQPQAFSLPLFRFEKEREFIRFLNDTEILHYGVIQSVIRRGGKGGAVEVQTGSLPDPDFESISIQLSAFGGRVSMEAEAADIKSMGLDISHYIESVLPQLEPGGDVLGLNDILLRLPGDPALFEETRDLVFRFGCEREFTILAGKNNQELFYLFRLRGIRSTYPLLKWAEDNRMTLFEPLADEARCFIERGYRFPLTKLGIYHPELSPVNLIPREGRWWKSGSSHFVPLGDLSELQFGEATECITLNPVAPETLPRSLLKLHLVEDSSASANGDAAERIQALEIQRYEIEYEIERMRHATNVAMAYRFDKDSVDSLLRFVTSHPLRFVRRFQFIPVGEVRGSGISYWVFPADNEHPDHLPKSVVDGAKVFHRQESLFREHAVQLFLPEGHRLDPPIQFSSAEGFKAFLKTGPTTQTVVLDTSDSELMPLVFQDNDRLTLPDLIKIANAAAIQNSESIRDSLLVSLNAALECTIR